MKTLKKSEKSKRSKGEGKPKKKKRAKPGAAKRRYNKEGVDQYGATRKGPQEDAL